MTRACAWMHLAVLPAWSAATPANTPAWRRTEPSCWPTWKPYPRHGAGRGLSALAIASPAGRIEWESKGVCAGWILLAPSTGTGGFGYDVLFAVEGYGGATLAELPPDVVSAVGHRGRAARQLLARARRHPHVAGTTALSGSDRSGGGKKRSLPQYYSLYVTCLTLADALQPPRCDNNEAHSVFPYSSMCFLDLT